MQRRGTEPRTSATHRNPEGSKNCIDFPWQFHLFFFLFFQLCLQEWDGWAGQVECGFNKCNGNASHLFYLFEPFSRCARSFLFQLGISNFSRDLSRFYAVKPSTPLFLVPLDFQSHDSPLSSDTSNEVCYFRKVWNGSWSNLRLFPFFAQLACIALGFLELSSIRNDGQFAWHCLTLA